MLYNITSNITIKNGKICLKVHILFYAFLYIHYEQSLQNYMSIWHLEDGFGYFCLYNLFAIRKVNNIFYDFYIHALSLSSLIYGFVYMFILPS